MPHAKDAKDAKRETWFCTVERRQALRREASRWIGTPFFPNSNTPGPQGGVSCQKLASEIYRGCGFAVIEVPEVAMAHARFSREPMLERFVDGRPEFQRVPGEGLWTAENLCAGDFLGFRLGAAVHHCGIYLGEHVFIHAIDRVGTQNALIEDPVWAARLEVVWRPRGTKD